MGEVSADAGACRVVGRTGAVQNNAARLVWRVGDALGDWCSVCSERVQWIRDRVQGAASTVYGATSKFREERAR